MCLLYIYVIQQCSNYSYSITTPRLILSLWVDDGLVLCSDQTLLRKLISHLQTKFEVTVGDADVYVGLHITRDLPNRRLFVDQQRFTETLLIKYGFQNVNTVSILYSMSLSNPLATNLALKRSMVPSDFT